MQLLYFIGVAVGGLVIGYSLPRKRGNRHLLHSINFKLDQLMATQAQLAQELRDIKDQNEKARTEILAKIAALEEALANAGNTTAEVDAALADLKASVQADDDLNPDTQP